MFKKKEQTLFDDALDFWFTCSRLLIFQPGFCYSDIAKYLARARHAHVSLFG